jgi:hypothetical protein
MNIRIGSSELLAYLYLYEDAAYNHPHKTGNPPEDL